MKSIVRKLTINRDTSRRCLIGPGAKDYKRERESSARSAEHRVQSVALLDIEAP